MREMTKLRFTKGRISLMVFPCIASFFISNVTGRTVSSCKYPASHLVSHGFFLSVSYSAISI
jgi:hypothetical protein